MNSFSFGLVNTIMLPKILHFLFQTHFQPMSCKITSMRNIKPCLKTIEFSFFFVLLWRHIKRFMLRLNFSIHPQLHSETAKELSHKLLSQKLFTHIEVIQQGLVYNTFSSLSFIFSFCILVFSMLRLLLHLRLEML